MSNTLPAGLTLPELAQRLHETEPAALLVRSRLLRRIIKRDCRIPGLGLRVPHGQGHVLSRDALLSAARLDELGVERPEQLADLVLLLPRPDPIDLRPDRVNRTLLTLSRRLLHVVLHRRVRERLSSEQIQGRIADLGQAAWEEIQTVLGQERLLLPPETPERIYEEFVAMFLELDYHAPHMLPRWFPALSELDAVRRMLEEDLGTSGLGPATLLPGSPQPGDLEAEARRDAELVALPTTLGLPPEKLLIRAQKALDRGNVVRSAILQTRAGQSAVAREQLAGLTRRLGQLFRLKTEEVERWDAVLALILDQAAKGSWTRAGRFLYDLQTACENRETPVFAVGLVEWLIRLGGPVRRPLPHQGEVLACKRLSRALERVAALPLPDNLRSELYHLLSHVLKQARQDVREAFQPRLDAVLKATGFIPRNHAEELARQKVVSELLEVIVDRGYLNLGLVRDTIARNRLKLGDLSGPGEFLVGDSLLKANAALAVQLDGVYYRGEVYLRWLQSVSSLLFGTGLGRVLTLYLLLPLLGSFLLLKFAEEIAHFFTHVELLTTESLLGVALALLLLIHSTPFRSLLWRLLWRVGQGLYWLFLSLPQAVLRWSPVQWIVQSRAFLFAFQVVVKPLGIAVGITALVWLLGVAGDPLLHTFLGVFLGALAVLNSRLGQHLEELAGDTVMRTWTLIRDDLLIGAFRALMDLFRLLLERVDRLFYTVDEWLRFREGEGRGSLVAKAILGTFWWAITYVFRFAFVVLIEPQINPIKHFPVVTVGHKVLLLAIEPTARALNTSFNIDIVAAGAAVTLVFGLIPGVFGFLAWELKENWRLYRENQSPTLDPVRVGSHGETVRGLLRPGFHSGTIPKLFAWLRHLPDRLETPRLHRTNQRLHHCIEAIEQFVQRDLIDALHATKIWKNRVELRVGHVHLETRRICIPIHAEKLDESSEPLVLIFEQSGPYLVFRVEEPGWVGLLKPDLALLWRDALIGFCKHAGVQVTATQVNEALPTGTHWRIDEGGLSVRRPGGTPGRYDLQEPVLVATDGAGVPLLDWPELPVRSVRFDAHAVTWKDWVNIWYLAQKGNNPTELLPGVPIPGCT